MRKNKIMTGIIMLLCFLALTGCGTKKVDVMESVTLTYSGVDGYGVASLENEYGWEKEALKYAGIEEIDNFSSLGDAFIIEMSVSYEVSPNENLSNGDEVTVTATVDNEAVKDYGIKFVAQEKKFKVDGLPEVQYVDLFENIDISYMGIAPNVTASIADANTDSYVQTRYILDKTSDLNIGDKITVTAEYNKDKLLEMGYVAESDTKEFVVEGVAQYADILSEIPSDAMEQLKKQTEDIIESDVARCANSNSFWGEMGQYSLTNKTFLGNYFMTAKNYESAYHKNYCYFVYKLDLSGIEEASCYFTVAYYDLIILEDGTCSYDFDKIIKPNPLIELSRHALYSGYDSLDKLYNECVTQNLAEYTSESTVVE